MERGILVAVWATLPITAGGAAGDTLAGWSPAPQVVAAALLWSAWAAALLGIAVPRPIGLTTVRTVAPLFALLAVVATVFGDVGTAGAAGAITATVVAAVLAARPAIALAAANGAAYGDEARFPLRVPPALFLAPLPLARILLGAAIATGPLLLADERVLPGAVALAVGAPVAVFAGRALHGLSQRWVVLVPAGLVVVDPLTLADPVLFLREHIVTLRGIGAGVASRDEILDLRLGATFGSVALSLDQPAEMFRASRARRGAVSVRATHVVVAVVRRPELLRTAVDRRIPAVVDGRGARSQAATPPPTSTSPS